MYSKSNVKKITTIITAVTLALLAAVICVFALLHQTRKAVNSDISALSSAGNVSSVLPDLSSEPTTPTEEVDLMPLVITSPKSLNSTVTSSQGYISGTSDPKEPLIMNGKEVMRNPDGSFDIETTLEIGKNTFTFVHKGKATVCTINYKYTIVNAYSPYQKQSYDAGSTFVVTVAARPNSTVKATFNGQTITLTRVQLQEEVTTDDFVNFTGPFTMPVGNAENISLGKIKYTATLNGAAETYYSPNIICLKDETVKGAAYVAQIVAFSAETFLGDTTDDWSRPTNNYLPRGTLDYCQKGLVYDSSSGNKYVKLNCGRRVYADKKVSPSTTGERTTVTQVFLGELPDHNEISVASVENTGKHTVMTFDTMWKAPFLLDMKPQAYSNPSKQDYVVNSFTADYLEITFCYATVFSGEINIPEDNPVFRASEIIPNGKNTIVRLYFKHTGKFYGYDCDYNAAGQLCFKFLNPTAVSAADNKYGTNLSGVKILIDVGHGGIDSGALGRNPAEHPESERNLSLANKLKAELESIGAQVVMTRYDNSTVTSDRRCEIVKEQLPDYCIAIHHDSSASASANGFGAFYFNPFASSAARMVLDRTAQTGVYSNCRALSWHYFYTARMTACPVVLTENGFISNSGDYNGIADQNTNYVKAEALTRAICDYFRSIS